MISGILRRMTHDKLNMRLSAACTERLRPVTLDSPSVWNEFRPHYFRPSLAAYMVIYKLDIATIVLIF